MIQINLILINEVIKLIECIPYPGYRDGDGYGQINSNKEGTLRLQE